MARSKRKSMAESLFDWERDVFRKAVLFGHWHDVDALHPRVGYSVMESETKILLRSMRKGAPMEEVVLSEETARMCERRSGEGCPSCIYILSDFKKNGKLTDYPGNYPVEAKIAHVESERDGSVS